MSELYRNSTGIGKVPQKHKSSALSPHFLIFDAFEGSEPVLPVVFPVRSALENEPELPCRPALVVEDPSPSTVYRPDRRYAAYRQV